MIALAVGALLSTAAAAQQPPPPTNWSQPRSDQDRDDARHRRIDHDQDRYHDRYRNQRYEPAPAPRTGEANPYAPKAGAPNPYATQGGAPNPYATRGGDPAKPLYEDKPRRR